MQQQISSAAIDDTLMDNYKSLWLEVYWCQHLSVLTVTFNGDEVPTLKSFNFGIWLLQGILNELPPKQRKRFLDRIYGSELVNPLWPLSWKRFREDWQDWVIVEWLGFVVVWLFVHLLVRQGLSCRIFSNLMVCRVAVDAKIQEESIGKGRDYSKVYLEGEQQPDVRTHWQKKWSNGLP